MNRGNGEAAWLAVGESELARLPAKASSSVQKLWEPPCIDESELAGSLAEVLFPAPSNKIEAG